MKKLLFIIAVIIIVAAFGQSIRLLPNFRLDNLLKSPILNIPTDQPAIQKQTVVYEESVITKVVEDALPSVVTVGISTSIQSNDTFQINPLNPFSPFQRIPGQNKKIDQNIGSGFIISNDGLIITNKHVVADTNAAYKVLTNDNKKYDVVNIYRDPMNDLAILKINTSNLKPLPLGDSSNLKLGQLAIAIGTPLGEFTNTVTKGIISGLGRGITAGSPYEEFVEKLDNVIQTDAPISPGNSGGPLLNSNGQVIGVNAAIAQEGQNLGFAIPSNIIRNLIETFNKQGGTFERPYVGVRYRMIDKQTAIIYSLAEGAYVFDVVAGSPAEKAEIQDEDVIVEFDGHKIKGDDDQGLTKLILQKKVGDSVSIKLWRGKEQKSISLILESGK